jgi:eukaryotic-like serine/threonine-protein kinase
MNERAIFIGAMERHDSADRSAYLTEACGSDTALRAQVEALLQENEQLGSFLESPASEIALLKLSADARAGCPIVRPLSAGDSAGGEYRILREIGRGGMGIVYEAEQVSLGRHVALKVLPAHSLLDPQRLQRFQCEAKAAARLHHTNIVPIYGVGEQAGLHYIAMQFIAGQSLDNVVHALRRRHELEAPQRYPLRKAAASVTTPAAREAPDDTLPEAGPASKTPLGRPKSLLPIGLMDSGRAYCQEVARIGLHAAEALEYAGQQGVLHRDIKPANLMLDETGQVWVMDFGLAKLTDGDDLTHSGELLGTLRYMAPERFQGRFDATSDVYSLGLTLYEVLTLRSAYDEADRGQLIARVLSVDPPRPRRINAAIPPDLETIVLKAIAREPQSRYATAGELAEDLRRFLADRPIHARRVSTAEYSWRWCRRNPAWAALMASIVVLGMAIVVISSISALWLGERATQAETAVHKAQEQLWVSKRGQARAVRMSRLQGQRIESLHAIADAMQLPVPPGHTLAELRTEAIAALALQDIEVEPTWPGGLTPGIVAVAVDRNLKYCARLAEDGAVTVFRVGDNHEVAGWHVPAPQPRRTSVASLRFSQDGRYVCIWNSDLRQLSVRRWGSAEPVLNYQFNDAGYGDAVCFAPDNTRLIYVASPDARISVVDLATGRARQLPPIDMRRPVIQCAPDSRRIAIAGVRGGEMKVEIRDLATGSKQTSFAIPAADNVALEWCPDGKTIATASDDQTSDDQAGIEHNIRLWNLPNGELLRTLHGHKNWGIRCSFDVSGARLLSNDWSHVLRLWETSSGKQLFSLPMAGNNLLQVSPDERLVAMPVADATTLELLRLHGNSEYRSLFSDLTRFGNVVVHPAGRLAALGSEGAVLLFDLATGRALGKLPTTDRPLRWNSAGALLTFGGSGLLSWPVQIDAKKPECYRLGPPQRLWTGGLKWAQWGVSDDARTVAIPNLDQGAVLIHRDSPPRITRLAQQDVRHCSVSPNGQWVATGSHNNNDGYGARIWEAASGRLVMKLPVSNQCRPTFSPYGRWLLTNAGGCRLWRVGTWTEGPKIGGPWGCFSPDGRLLAVEEDVPGGVRLVETETGLEVARLESPEQSRLSPQCFSPDGTRLIAWGQDTGSLHVWDLLLLRQELAQLGLDWKAPPYSPAQRIAPALPLQVEVVPGVSP